MPNHTGQEKETKGVDVHTLRGTIRPTLSTIADNRICYGILYLRRVSPTYVFCYNYTSNVTIRQQSSMARRQRTRREPNGVIPLVWRCEWYQKISSAGLPVRTSTAMYGKFTRVFLRAESIGYVHVGRESAESECDSMGAGGKKRNDCRMDVLGERKHKNLLQKSSSELTYECLGLPAEETVD